MSVAKSESQTESVSMYEQVKDAVEEKGELMVRMASGAEHELHRHNVEFGDAPMIRIDADEATHWLDASKVERYWIHAEF